MKRLIVPFFIIVSFVFASNLWADCSSEVYDYDSGQYLYNTDAQSKCEDAVNEAVEEAVNEACDEGFRKCRNECNNDYCEDACRIGKRACKNSI